MGLGATAKQVPTGLTSRVVRRGGYAVAALLACVPALPAQTLVGRVTDRATGAPVAGAIVSLLTDTLRRWPVLTDSTGAFRLRAGEAGTYRLRVDRIGFAPFLPELPVVLPANALVERPVQVPAERSVLATVRVTADAACNAPGIRGDDAVRVWEQARTAFSAAAVTSAQALVPLEIRVDESITLTPAGRGYRIGSRPRETQVARTRAARAFVTPPGHDVRSRGFRVAAGDSAVFLGPDADVALSDGFLAAHCFRVVRSSGLLGRGKRLGLAFAPLDTTQATFLRGTMWLDEASARLDELTYTYVVPGWPERMQRPTGAIAFSALPGGAWVVRDWQMRIPLLMQPQRDDGQQLSVRWVATYEKRGRMRALQAAEASDAASTVAAASNVLITGRVSDALDPEPLPGVGVLVGGRAATTTNATGGFAVAVTSVSATGVTVVVETDDPLLRRLLGDSAERVVLLAPGDTARVNFATPAAAAVLPEVCPMAIAPPADVRWGANELGALLVALRRAPQDSMPLTARVEWQWRDGATPKTSVVEDTVAADGVFVACPVATDRLVTLIVSDATGERLRMVLPEPSQRVRTLRVTLEPRP